MVTEPAAQDEEIRRKWIEWLGVIERDIRGLIVNRHIFWEVQEIIKLNPELHQASSFYEWMGNVYATDAVIGVRRQLDTDSRSISLARFLTEMRDFPGVISRVWYQSLYKPLQISKDLADLRAKGISMSREFGWTVPDPVDLANREFDKFAGRDGTHVDPNKVTADLDSLKNKAQNLHRYANKRIAHFDAQPYSGPPTFNDLNDCLDFLETLLSKYVLLLRAVSLQVLPTWMYDWKEVFRIPWIK